MTFVSMTQSLYASELLAFLDADCRAPSTWLERVEAEFLRRRRPVAVGFVRLSPRCHIYTSARRYKAMGRLGVLWLYISNFAAEILRHRPRDLTHEDIRN